MRVKCIFKHHEHYSLTIRVIMSYIMVKSKDPILVFCRCFLPIFHHYTHFSDLSECEVLIM